MAEEDLLKVRPTQTHGRSETTKTTSCQGFIQICEDNPSFLYCIFLFPTVKNAFKRKGLQGVDNIKKNVMAEMNALLLEASADCF
jgi:hypothetical protein